MYPQFRLRTLLLFVALSALVMFVANAYIFRPPPIMHVNTLEEWEAVTRHRRVVLFVNGEWSYPAAMFQSPFLEFGQWCRDETEIRAVQMTIDSSDTSNDVWSICDEMWSSNDIDPGSMKTFGGAGRVVWLEDGEVLDYAWAWETMQQDELKQRTADAFCEIF